jgi:hypothetical protein
MIVLPSILVIFFLHVFAILIFCWPLTLERVMVSSRVERLGEHARTMLTDFCRPAHHRLDGDSSNEFPLYSGVRDHEHSAIRGGVQSQRFDLAAMEPDPMAGVSFGRTTMVVDGLFPASTAIRRLSVNVHS